MALVNGAAKDTPDTATPAVAVVHLHFLNTAVAGAAQPALLSRAVPIDLRSPVTPQQLRTLCGSLFGIEPFGLVWRGSFLPLSALCHAPARWNGEHLFLVSVLHAPSDVSALLEISSHLQQRVAEATDVETKDSESPQAVPVDPRTRSKMRASVLQVLHSNERWARDVAAQLEREVHQYAQSKVDYANLWERALTEVHDRFTRQPSRESVENAHIEEGHVEIARRRAREQQWLQSHAQFPAPSPTRHADLWRQRSREPSAPALERNEASAGPESVNQPGEARQSAQHQQRARMRAADLFKPSAPALPDDNAGTRAVPGRFTFGVQRTQPSEQRNFEFKHAIGSGDDGIESDLDGFERAASEPYVPSARTLLIAGAGSSGAPSDDNDMVRQFSNASSYRPTPPAPSPWYSRPVSPTMQPLAGSPPLLQQTSFTMPQEERALDASRQRRHPQSRARLHTAPSSTASQDASSAFVVFFPLDNHGNYLPFTLTQLGRIRQIRRSSGLSECAPSDLLARLLMCTQGPYVTFAEYSEFVFQTSDLNGHAPAGSRVRDELREHLDTVFSFLTAGRTHLDVLDRRSATRAECLCSLLLLSGGSVRSKLRLVFTMADDTDSQRVTQRQVEPLLRAVYRGLCAHSSLPRGRAMKWEKKVIGELLSRCFAESGRDSCTLKQWIHFHKSFPSFLCVLHMGEASHTHRSHPIDSAERAARPSAVLVTASGSSASARPLSRDRAATTQQAQDQEEDEIDRSQYVRIPSPPPSDTDEKAKLGDASSGSLPGNRQSRTRDSGDSRAAKRLSRLYPSSMAAAERAGTDGDRRARRAVATSLPESDDTLPSPANRRQSYGMVPRDLHVPTDLAHPYARSFALHSGPVVPLCVEDEAATRRPVHRHGSPTINGNPVQRQRASLLDASTHPVHHSSAHRSHRQVLSMAAFSAQNNNTDHFPTGIRSASAPRPHLQRS